MRILPKRTHKKTKRQHKKRLSLLEALRLYAGMTIGF